MKGKRGLMTDYLIWIILAIIVLVVLVGWQFGIGDSLESLGSYFKNLLRFG